MSDAAICPCKSVPVVGPKICEKCNGATTWIADKGIVVCLTCDPEWSALVDHDPLCPRAPAPPTLGCGRLVDADLLFGPPTCDGCERPIKACDAELPMWLTPRCVQRRGILPPFPADFGRQVDLLEEVYRAGGLRRLAERTGRPLADLRRAVLAAQRAVVPVFQRADLDAVAEVRADVGTAGEVDDV